MLYVIMFVCVCIYTYIFSAYVIFSNIQVMCFLKLYAMTSSTEQLQNHREKENAAKVFSESV